MPKGMLYDIGCNITACVREIWAVCTYDNVIRTFALYTTFYFLPDFREYVLDQWLQVYTGTDH